MHAAVDEVADHGIRALTHTRVDRRAGLPPGSTSNWFRTRSALLAGLVEHIAASERTTAPTRAAEQITSPDALVDTLTATIEALTGEHARRTRVRLTLFLDAAHDDELLAPLHEQRAAFVTWTTALLAQVGARHPAEAARTLLACGNGLVFHRLTVDPEAPVRPVVERAVRACLD
nr:TetR family transcriptional regulator [Isoptericola halotolerans]